MQYLPTGTVILKDCHTVTLRSRTGQKIRITVQNVPQQNSFIISANSYYWEQSTYEALFWTSGACKEKLVKVPVLKYFITYYGHRMQENKYNCPALEWTEPWDKEQLVTRETQKETECPLSSIL